MTVKTNRFIYFVQCTLIQHTTIKVRGDAITVEVNTNGELRNFISKNFIHDLAALKADELYPEEKYFIIREFDQLARNDEDREVPCQGFIGSNKRMLNNLSKLVSVQPDRLILYLDGTYKLLINGWVLILLGGVTLKQSVSGAISHSFVPVLECITRSECEPAFAALFSAFCDVADKYAAVRLKISVVVQDHCQASFNAVRNTLEHLLIMQVELLIIELIYCIIMLIFRKPR